MQYIKRNMMNNKRKVMHKYIILNKNKENSTYLFYIYTYR